MSTTAKRGRIRALIVEDSPDDVEIMLLELKAAGFDVLWQVVETAQTMEEALGDEWDIILCDYWLPHFDCLQALELLNRGEYQIPLVLVSGAVGEEGAANAMRAGARDFVSKDNLARLAPAVERELRETAERRARQQVEQAFRNLVEQSLLGILILQENRVVFANQAVADMLGYSIEEMIGAAPGSIVDATHPEDRHAMWARFSDYIEAPPPPATEEFCLTRRDGTTLWVVASQAQVEFNAAPAIQLALVNITLRRQLEEALAKGKEEWERIFDTVSELILLTDASLDIIRLNQAPCDRLSVHPRALIGRPVTEIIGCPAALIPLDSLMAGSTVDIDIDSEPLGGLLRFNISPRHGSDGSFGGAIFVGRDITAQARIEELERRQATIDQAEHIFRTFRHETGNALNTLKTTLSVFRSRFDDFPDEKRREYFDRCFEALRIAEQLLHAVRRYQTLDEVRLQSREIVDFVTRSADLLFENARGQGVGCSLQAHAGELVVQVDPDALIRVLLNLVENAAAACEDQPAPQIVLTVSERKDQAVIEVSDNGSGIPTADLPRVFQPLFSTRADGSGMGLAIVQKLMVRMQGLATLHSEEGQGTTVTLQLPIVR